jgi:hypothetical protein
MRVLTPEQELLLEYLTALKTPLISSLSILASLQDQEATLEMLQYIAKTEETDLAQLLKVASRISKKYNQDTE